MATEVLWEIQNVISVMEIDCVCDHEGFILLLKIKSFYFQHICQGHMYYIDMYKNSYGIRIASKTRSYLDDIHYKKQLVLQHGFFSISMHTISIN